MLRWLVISIPFISLFAQGPPPPPPDRDPRAIIEKVRIYELTQRLNLTTEQAIKFFPKLNELRKNEESFQNQRREIIRDLKDLVDKKATDDEFNKVLKRFEDARREKWQKDSLLFQDFKTTLTPLQQANLIIFEEEFEREIREMIRKIRENRPPPTDR